MDSSLFQVRDRSLRKRLKSQFLQKKCMRKVFVSPSLKDYCMNFDVNFFRMLSEEESSERMDEVDEDEDGYVTWAEYIAETYGIKDPEDQQLLDQEDQVEEQRVRLEKDRDVRRMWEVIG